MAFGLAAAVGAAIAKAVKTASDTTKKKGTSSGGSSGSGRSSGKTTSSGGSGRSSGKTIEQYQADYNAAKAKGDQAGMDAAHAGAQAIRAQQGYSGGSDGTQHININPGTSASPKYNTQTGQNMDYKAMMDAADDNWTKGYYENLRNQKIDSLGLPYEKTYTYQQYYNQTAPNGISSAFDKTNNRYDLSNSSLTSKNTGAGKGVTAIEPGYIGWNAGYTQDFQSYIDQDTKWIQEYEKALENPNLTDKMRKLYQSHLVAAYNDRAEQEQNRNAKLYAMGRSDLMTDLYQDQGNGTKGWLQDFSSVGNGAKSLSAGYIYSQEQLAARLENAFQNATSDAEREVIWRDLAPIERQLGRAYDAKTGQFSATTVSATRDHYGKKANAAGYSYGALTNGAVNTDADRALLAQGLQAAKDERDAAAANGMYTPEWYLSNMPNRESGQANDPTRYNGLTEEDYKALYIQAKANGDKAGMEAAHAGAQAIRAQQGYDGGEDGSKRIPIGSSDKTTGTAQGANFPGVGLALGGMTLGGLGLSGIVSGALDNALATQQVTQPTYTLPEIEMPDFSGGGYDMGGWDQINSMYEQQQNAMNAANQAAIDQAINQIQSQIPGVNQNYEDAARQYYINQMQQKKKLPEQLAAAGISNQGAAESTLSKINSDYTGALNSADVARQNALSDINNSIANAQLQGTAQAAESAAQLASQKASAYQNWLAQQQSAQQAQQQLAMQYYQNQIANQQWQQQFDYQKQQDAIANQLAQKQYQDSLYRDEAERRLQNQQYNRNQLIQLMQIGYKPTAQDAANTGYTLAQLNQMYNQFVTARANGYLN